MYRAAYRFLEAGFVLESDSPAFLERFAAAYGRLQIEPAAGLPVYQVRLTGEPCLALDGRVVQSGDREALSEYAYNAILNAAAARVRSHWLLHAAALRAPDGRGVILAGSSGLGKTTLTLGLLRRGFGFLSDDIAALRRRDGWLDPFPRRLGVRPPGARPGEKQAVDIDALAPGGLAAACPAGRLFVLASNRPAPPAGTWHLLLDRVEPGLLDDLARLPGVAAACLASSGAYPVVEVRLQERSLAELEPQAAALCAQRGVLLFEITRRPAAPPDFRRAPALERLAPAQAAGEVLNHLKNGAGSALWAEEYLASPARLYLDLAARLAGIDCFRLTVGRLDQMLMEVDHALRTL